MKEFIEKLIGRLEELKKTEQNRPDDCDEEGYGDGEQIYDDGRSQGRFEQTHKIIEIVNELAEEHKLLENIEQLNNGWIPCSERLPEANKDVLVCTNEGQVDADYYGEYIKDFIGLKGTEQYAIAWMPLPAPYKEGVTENE